MSLSICGLRTRTGNNIWTTTSLMYSSILVKRYASVVSRPHRGLWKGREIQTTTARRRVLSRNSSHDLSSGMIDPSSRPPIIPLLAIFPFDFSLDSLPTIPTLTSLLSPLSDLFLSYPILSSYSLTIIALTIFLRTCITLPANLWARKRNRIFK